MPEHISITEAARRFGLSEKTIRNWIKWRWLKAESVKISGRTHKLIDPAALHQLMQERGLPEHTATPEHSGMTFNMEEIKEELQSLSDRIFDLENNTSISIQLVEIRARLIVLERSRDVVESRISTDSRTARKTSLASSHAQKQASQIEAGGSLPAGYVGAQEFRHHIPETTALRWAREYGETGDWRSARGHKVTLAFSPEMQRAYYEKFHEHDLFERCTSCPHEIQEQNVMREE